MTPFPSSSWQTTPLYGRFDGTLNEYINPPIYSGFNPRLKRLMADSAAQGNYQDRLTRPKLLSFGGGGGLPPFGGGDSSSASRPLRPLRPLRGAGSGFNPAANSQKPIEGGAINAPQLTPLGEFRGGFGGDTAGGGFGSHYTIDGHADRGETAGDYFARHGSGLDRLRPLGQPQKALRPLGSFDPTGRNITQAQRDAMAASYTPEALDAEARNAPFKAHGGTLPPLQPFIAGDPQEDGEPNPELILPKFGGGVDVIPLRNFEKGRPGDRGTRRGLPKFGGDVPALKALPKLAYGTVEDLGGSRAAYDDQNHMVGYSTNVTDWPEQALPDLSSSPRLPISPSGSGGSLRPLPSMDNPEGITVGVTPRPALRPLEPLPSMSDEERRYGRLERQLWQQSRSNPALAAQLLNSRAEDARSRNTAAARQALELFQQDRLDAREWMQEKGRSDRASVENNFKLAKESRDAAEYARKMFTGDEEPSVKPIPGTNYVMPFVGRKSFGPLPTNAPPDYGTTETFPGSGEYVRTKNGDPLTKLGTATMTGPGQFKPLVKEKDPDPTGVKAVKDHLAQIEKLQAMLVEKPGTAPLDAARKARLNALLDHHFAAYEAGLGIETPPVTAPAPATDAMKSWIQKNRGQ